MVSEIAPPQGQAAFARRRALHKGQGRVPQRPSLTWVLLVGLQVASPVWVRLVGFGPFVDLGFASEFLDLSVCWFTGIAMTLLQE